MCYVGSRILPSLSYEMRACFNHKPKQYLVIYNITKCIFFYLNISVKTAIRRFLDAHVRVPVRDVAVRGQSVAHRQRQHERQRQRQRQYDQPHRPERQQQQQQWRRAPTDRPASSPRTARR